MTHELRRDGETVATGTPDELMRWVLRHTSFSFHEATTHQGYEMIETPEPQTVATFAAALGLTFEAEPIEARADGLMADMPEGSRHYACTIRRAGYTPLTLEWSQGPAITDAPTLADVLSTVADDAAGYENAQGFEPWAEEYGYDTDSRRAEATFRAIEAEAGNLRALLGDEDYRALLWDVTRD